MDDAVDVATLRKAPMIAENLVMGTIFDIKRFSIHDGPGIRTTIFLKGCPLNCWWCHNPESQDPKPELVYRENRCVRCRACLAACGQNAISENGAAIVIDAERCTLCGKCVEICYAEAREILGRVVSVPQVVEQVERDIPFYDQSGGGVTFSGGEPLMQPAFLLALLKACRASEIHAAMDTCGFMSWSTINRLRDYIDLFLYDLKLVDNAKHRKYTGVSNEVILDNLGRLAKLGHEICLRLPIIPGINDSVEDIQTVGAFAATLPHLKRVDLLPYHRAAENKYQQLNRTYALAELRAPTEEKITELAEVLQSFGLTVQIGG